MASDTLSLSVHQIEDSHRFHLRFPRRQGSLQQLLVPWQLEGLDQFAPQSPKTGQLVSLPTKVGLPPQAELGHSHLSHLGRVSLWDLHMQPGFQLPDWHLHPTSQGRISPLH